MATGAFAPPTTILRLSSSSPPLRATLHPTPLRLALPSRSSPPTSRSGWLSLRAPAAKGSLRVRCGATVVDQSSFEAEVLSSEGPVLVEFVADWCGPCRLVAPMVDWAAKEYKDSLKVVKIDHDANPELVKEYKVYGLPTLILFKNGQKVPGSHREGAITKVKLKEYLDSLLESVSVS